MSAETSRENQGPWSEKDALQFLFFEMGKDGTQGGISKSKAMDPFSRLLSVAEPAETQRDSAALLQPSALTSEIPSRRQRKGCRPSRLPPPNEISPPTIESSADIDEKKLDSREPCIPQSPPVCRNPACKAQLPSAVSFCKRCSCCICKQFDVDKDPSLWISCSSESLVDGNAGCGLCCHVECALKAQVAGVVSNGSKIMLDGSYRCPSCGRVSALIGCWKKQLDIAKAARGVDTLCHRLFLSRRLLNGTLLYKDVQAFVVEAAKRLEAEVGPMVEGSAKLVCGIVNKLSCNADVQRLIGLALENLEISRLDAQAKVENSKLSEEHIKASCAMHFEEVSSSSIVVHVDDDTTSEPIGYKLWHRKLSNSSYASAPTCVISGASKKVLVSNLQAHTEYAFKIVPFSEHGDEPHCEAECCTKVDETNHRPKELQCSLGLIVSNEKKMREGNSSCLDEGLQMKCDPEEFNARFKVHDYREVCVRQQERALNANEGLSLSKGFPSILKEEGKAQRDGHLRTPLSNGKPSVRGDASNVHWGGTDVIQVTSSSTSDVLENGNCQSKEVPNIVPIGNAVPNTGKVRARKVPCMCTDSLVEEPLGITHPRILDSEKEKERVIIFDTVQCLYNSALCEHCSTTKKRLVTNGVESDRPCQSWAVQVRSQERGFGMKAETAMERKQPVPSLEKAHSHMKGSLSTTRRADCGANSFEFSVKVIRWLECEGHLKQEFRMKFLTWYSLRATDHEKRVVSVFIDTLQDDPVSLAGQLVDTFEEIVASKRQHLTGDGYCSRAWQ